MIGSKATMELVLDCQDPNRLASFWLAALDYRNHFADAELAVLVPKEGCASPLLLQQVFTSPKRSRTACTST